MNSMFGKMKSLETLDLSGFNTANVTNMADLFLTDTKLSNITFGNKFSTAQTLNMSRMFCGLPAMTNLDLSQFNTEKVTDMSSIFNGCTEMQKLDLSNFTMNSGADTTQAVLGCTPSVKCSKDRYLQNLCCALYELKKRK